MFAVQLLDRLILEQEEPARPLRERASRLQSLGTQNHLERLQAQTLEILRCVHHTQIKSRLVFLTI